MAEDPEKRFHSIMDKLFSSPKSLSTPSRVESSSRGKKRSNPESALALVEPKTPGDVVRTPLCRPWDRGDLMRRMATFKSMTWFAKPKVVSAVNCARKGWVNLDVDIIGCEACGSRLLFSAPSSWTQQQVEKAAMVFSLKLDNRHKLQCPWINNACDERLAEFPPTPHPVLVDKFRERSSALMQLLALPVISSAAMKHMKNAQLEEFLRQSETLDYGNGSISISQVDSFRSDSEADSASLYYQALKLTSLCGWEPRSLPYFVDCNNRAKPLIQDAETLNQSHIVSAQKTSISFYSPTANENSEASDNSNELTGLSADPHSMVLDCKLCGATVGLWTYSTVPRPLELLRLVGYDEPHSKKNFGQDSSNGNKVDERGAIVNSPLNGTLSCTDRPSNLGLTIAGGPPPTKQNFKATISLPIIGRNLRARFSYDSDFRDRIFNVQESQSEIRNKNLYLEEFSAGSTVGKQVSQSEPEGELNSKAQGQCSYAIGELSSPVNLESGEKGYGLGQEGGIYMSLEGTEISGEGIHDSIMELLKGSFQEMAQGLDENSRFSETAQNVDFANSPAQSLGSSQVTMPDQGANIINGNEITASDSNIQNRSSSQERGEKVMNIQVQDPPSFEIIATGTGREPKQTSDDAMEFDPIRQHRHFCPWIISTNSGAAGWQQTLSALFRQKEHSSPSEKSPPPSSMIKVDDPITSVRNLFRTPPAKRTKPTR
ncbi:C3HC zinc finger-like [Euphorbia peplus]|nr:C3HC zinc finger-like [Euphorbia peplus]